MSESKHKKNSADNIEVAIKLNGSLMPGLYMGTPQQTCSQQCSACLQ